VAANLAANLRSYDVPIIGIYGRILAGQAEGNDAGLGTALALMQLVATHSEWNPRLELAIARVEQRLGQTAAARERIARVRDRNGDLEAAQRLLSPLED